ncbi:MAG TPA: hypothetical protein VJU34_12930 [Phenylobacterium sp.]|nr:hypothetical protein [Phenylobacterium sp.]
MRRPVRPTEDQLLRLGAALAGAIFLASAALAAVIARDHMVALGTVCGAASHAHCGWCLGTAGLVLAGLAAFAAALRKPIGSWIIPPAPNAERRPA